MIENKKYYIDRLNSSKANRMTSLYHYSGVGFKKSILNLGVFRKDDDKLVGVLQFGCSFQEGIKLDRYVKENIAKEEYLELNRFSMADSEGKNSESQAISLGIKWIKKFMPNIRLLVSYAGRKEGNYGYIYQATNWEYLGYFISEGFWSVDGEERHLATLWNRYTRYANQSLGFIEGLCDMYSDVRKTSTKQFIYIMRLDKTLTCASEPLPYPKPITDFPIKTREVIYKRDDEIYNNYVPKERDYVEYFYEVDKYLFLRSTLIKRGELEVEERKISMYDPHGNLMGVFNKIKDINHKDLKHGGIRQSLSSGSSYKTFYFRYFFDEPLEEIDVPAVCYIDDIPFKTCAEAARYIGVSRQAVNAAKIKGVEKVNGYDIKWSS